VRKLQKSFLKRYISSNHFEKAQWAYIYACLSSKSKREIDAILPRKGPITRTMSKRLQEDWARAAEEGPRVLMNLRVDF